MKKDGKLYLVRKNYEKMIGPMPIDKVVSGLYHLDFSKSDELSGSLGPWVKFEDVEALVKYYPEINAKLHPHRGSSFELQGATKPQLRRSNQNKFKRSHVASIMFVIFAVLLGLFALKYIPQWQENLSLTLENAKNLQKSIEDTHKMVGLNGVSKILSEEEQHYVRMGQKFNEFLVFMLPYWRHYSFEFKKDGFVENISPKVLIDSEQYKLPFADCSIPYWRQTFASESTSALLWLRKLPWPNRAPVPEVIKLLLLEKGWLQRRFPKGWIAPHNSLIGCAKMASFAWRDLMAKASRKDVLYQVIYDRLASLGEVIPGAVAIKLKASQDSGVNFLNFLSCAEQAENKTQLQDCDRFSLPEQMAELKIQRILLSMISLVLDNQSQITEELMITTAGGGVFKERDSIDLMDLKAETNFLELIKEGLNASNASFKVALVYPDVVF